MPWKIITTLILFFIFPLSEQDIKIVSIGDKEYVVEIARTEKEKREGLSGRKFLAPDEAMLFIYRKPEYLIYQTQEMLFPIDIIFIKEGKVIEIFSNVHPGNIIRSSDHSDMVFETNAGSGIKAGETLNF